MQLETVMEFRNVKSCSVNPSLNFLFVGDIILSFTPRRMAATRVLEIGTPAIVSYEIVIYFWQSKRDTDKITS